MSSGGTRLIGAHMPAAGGLAQSLLRGREIGCTAVQVFVKSPRQWSASPLDPEAAAQFRQAQADTGIAFTAAHDSYLINLAAPDAAILEKSRAAFRDELERAEMLEIPWVVTHMGAHLNSSRDDSIAVLCESMRLLLNQTEGMRAGIAMETTAGQGTCLGARFEEIARVVEGCAEHPRLGVCFDTCHVFAAGYDLRDPDAYESTLQAFDRILGLDRLKLIHANDSKKPLGSRVDRHEHIGDGEIGLEAFRRLVTDPRLREIPIIVETPDADSMHEVNVARLRALLDPPEKLSVTVRVFGHYRDYCPDEIRLTVDPAATVDSVAAAIAERDPRLVGIRSHCRAAVNEEFVDSGQPVRDGDVVAFIPPMSGG